MTTNSQQPTSPARLAPLDGLRGLAACGVAFLYHPQALFDPATLATAPRVLQWFEDWGWTLVDLFFLISGYIFAHVYLRGEGLGRDRLAPFAVARIARLYPLHLLTLCLCALLFAGDPANTAVAFGAHLLMLQAFVQPVAHTFNGPSWSISVEVLCYVLFAMAACRGERTLRRVGAVAIAAALAHLLLQGRPGGPWVGDGLPRGLLGFFLGQALWRWRDRLASLPALLLAAAVVAGLVIDMGRFSSLLPLCLLVWPGLLLLALRTPWMGTRAMQWLGDRSYAIYLVHYPVLLAVEGWHGRFAGGMATVWAVTAVFAGGVLVLSDLCYRLFELPARGAIRAAWARRAAAPETRPA